MPEMGRIPEPERPGVSRLNALIHRRTTELLAGCPPGAKIDDENSVLGQDIDARIALMQAKHVDPLRITVVSAIAHIDHYKTRAAETGATVLDSVGLSAVMEEEPRGY